MSVLLRPLLGAALLALVPTIAFAQSAAPSAAPSTETAKPSSEEGDHDGLAAAKRGRGRLAVCRDDVAKLCADTARGGRRACLKSNEAKLSPACAAAFADVENKAKVMREACAEDVKSHCATAGKGKGGQGIVKCLRANVEKVTAACNAAIAARYSKN